MKKKRNNRIKWLFGLITLFIFRVFFGLSKFSGDDEFQIYLIGLKFYCQKKLELWGADIFHFENSQIPGSLQSVLVGGPFYVWEHPLSPFIFLNILSLSALLFFAFYVKKQVPGFPILILFGLLFLSPWTLHYSTHIENPSYILISSILFFCAVFDLIPVFPQTILPRKLAFACLGFALCWHYQIHMSWVMLLPYIGLVFGVQRQKLEIFWFLIGCFASGIFLFPTLYYEFEAMTQQNTSNLGFYPKKILDIPLIILRFFSLASFEVPRYLGADNTLRIQFLKEYWPLLPVIGVLLLAGFWQVWFYIRNLFIQHTPPYLAKLKLLILMALALLCGSFLFTPVLPASHTFYLFLPLVFMYAFTLYQHYVDLKEQQRKAYLVLACAFIFHLFWAKTNHEQKGILPFFPNIKAALAHEDYTRLGLRRESSLHKKRALIQWDKKNTPNGKQTFFTAFKPVFPSNRPQNILSKPKSQDNYVLKIDSLQPFGPSFSFLKSSLTDSIFIQTSIQNPNAKLTAVCELFSPSKEKLAWLGSELHPMPPHQQNDSTFLYQTLFTLPSTPDSTFGHIYFWLQEPKQGLYFLDSWIIEGKNLSLNRNY